jgi:uncharacterized RDD family membrane protein YckC
MSSAQLEIQQPDATGFDDAHAAPAPFALKQQAAERIAAHRARRQRTSPAAATPIAIASPAKARATRIAAAVAERYAQSQSYRAFLAAEAEKAIHQAEAAADVAVLTAQAVADAQYSLLAELDQLVTPSPQTITNTVANTSELSAPATQALASHAPRTQPAHQPASQATGAGVTVRLLEDLASHSHLAESFTNALLSPTANPLDDEGMALDEEIAFRQAPTFEPSTPPVEIPANLIEFPRQLVAARRARPRIAEGPLREDGEPQDSTAQLRIFEVEATQISTAPAADSAATEWSSILLDAYPATSAQEAQYAADYAQDALAAQLSAEIPPQAATLNLRLMAAAVDFCIVLASFLAFTAVFAITVGKLPIGQFNLQATVIAAGGVLALLAILYQLLFFTFSDATPGMRYARIGLCTLTDENPSRSAMRRRIFALLLCACPLGIGVLWAWLDADRLGWHDRISRMYQRSY